VGGYAVKRTGGQNREERVGKAQLPRIVLADEDLSGHRLEPGQLREDGGELGAGIVQLLAAVDRAKDKSATGIWASAVRQRFRN